MRKEEREMSKKTFVISVLVLLVILFSEKCFGIQVKGMNYDIGVWSDPISRGEFLKDLYSIKSLNCNTIRLCGNSNLLVEFATVALDEGFNVWVSPRYINKNFIHTLKSLKRLAAELEYIRERYPDRVVLIVGNELTLDMKGLIKGDQYIDRVRRVPFAFEYNKKLNKILKIIAAEVRLRFKGKLLYAAAIHERVDHIIFDFIGVNYYTLFGIGLNLGQMKKEYNKDIVITEFGTCNYRFSSLISPISWYPPRTFLKHFLVKDDTEQIEYYKRCFDVFREVGVYGTFVYTFAEKRKKAGIGSYGIVSREGLRNLIKEMYKY